MPVWGAGCVLATCQTRTPDRALHLAAPGVGHATGVVASGSTASATPCFAAVESYATAVGGSNVAVGTVLDSAGASRAAIWHLGPPDTLEVLPLPAGYDRAGADGANAAGVVVGAASRGSATDRRGMRAVRWTPSSVELLPSLSGYQASAASSVNARGAVAGVVTDARGRDRAVIWSGGGISPLPPTPPGGVDVIAVSNAGDVAGTIFPTGPGPDANSAQAVVWRHGRVQRIFARAQGSTSTVNGASPGGLVVGGVGTATRSEGVLAFVWSPGSEGGTVDTSLKTADAGITRYTGANDRGVLVGVDDGLESFVRVRGQRRTLPSPAGWSTAAPVAVNDAGLIAGTAESPAPGSAPPLPHVLGDAGRRLPTRAVAWDTSGRVRVLPLGPVLCRPASR